MIIDFGNGFQTVTFWLLAVFVGVTGLLTLGTALAAAVDRDLRKGMAASSLVLGALTVWLGSAIGERLERFEQLIIEPDNTWRAESLVGSEVLRLGPDDMRAVDFMSRRVEGEPLTWVQIELPDGRRFLSLEAREAAQREAFAALRAQIGGHR